MTDPNFNNTIVPFVQETPENQEPDVNASSSKDNNDHVNMKRKRVFTLFGFTMLVDDFPEETSEKLAKINEPDTTTADPKVATRNPAERKRRKTKGQQEEEAEPVIPPRILQEINNNPSHEGAMINPVFLYKKKLELSDVKQDKNRLLVTVPMKLLELLTDEEKEILEYKEKKIRGIKFNAVDPRGKYHELVLVRWPSLNMIALRKGWYGMIADNKVEDGDWVELLGFRQDSKLFLAVNFKKSEKTAERISNGTTA